MIVEIAEGGSAYIRYRIGERPVGNTIEIGGEGSEALADLNADGDVVGIEIADVKIPESIERARAFATDRGLAFPRDLATAAERLFAA